MSNNNEEYKTGAEAIAMLEKTGWGKEKKARRITKIARAAKRGIEGYMAERKEKKEIYKKAFKVAETAAIITKARREARAKHAPRPRGRGRGAGLFDLPSGITAPTIFGKPFGEAPRRRKKRRKAKRPKKRRRRYY